MKFLVKYGLLPVLFLMGFAMSSDAFRFGFLVDLSMLIVIAFDFYYLFMYKNRIRGGISYAWWLYILVVPTLVMTLLEGGSLKMMLTNTLILMLPFALEPFVPGNDKQTVSGFFLTFAVSAALLLMYSNFGFLGSWNPNAIAYLLFLGICGSIIVISVNRKNIAVWLLLAYIIIQLLVTQSRNVISALLLVIALVFFKKTVSKRMVYRIVYILALVYPAVFPAVSLKSDGTQLYLIIRNITESVFDKSSVFSGRTILFQQAENVLSSSVFNNIFGFGDSMTNVVAAHNDYYLIRYAYGIIGTVIILALFICFFEKAYVLVRKGDDITYGCVAVIIGILFQQASEGWFIASPLPVLMAFVYMAIVIKRYRMSEGKHLKNENV